MRRRERGGGIKNEGEMKCAMGRRKKKVKEERRGDEEAEKEREKGEE